MVALNFDANTNSLSMGATGRWLNLPQEMRERRQWAVSSLVIGSDGKPDKRPLNLDGSGMDWRNPLQWLTFEQAVNSGYPAIGFILSPADPFTIIDLDVKEGTPQEVLDRHTMIMDTFKTYTELSQSGKGVHLILYGRISGGVRRDAVEVYDQDRYMICSGNTLAGRTEVIAAPDLLERLVHEMGGVQSTLELPPSGPELEADEVLLERMANARNGERFKQLFYGPVDMGSENDAALFALLSFYTKNHEQILRLFARSVLYRPRGEADGKKGHTEKSYHEKYLADTLARALQVRTKWDKVNEADVEHGRSLAQGMAAAAPRKEEAPRTELPWPPGLVGEIAEYIYYSSPRPLKEVAIAGALAFMAGVCGRQFNVSNGAGLNLYIILLAESGLGKEAAKGGVDRLFAAITKEAPGTHVFLGPRAVSGPALEKAVSEHNPCFVTFVGEIGVRLQQMLAKKSGDPLFKAALLGLYTAAVRGGRHQGAFHSKKDDRTESITFPAVSLFGESTPSEYYKAISGSNFEDGFVPRFLTLSHHGTKIGQLNPSRGLPPPTPLVDKLVHLAQHAVDLQVRDQYIEIGFAPGITAEKVDAFYMAKASALPPGPARTAWTRAPMQMFKVAGLLAVGTNNHAPVITEDCLDWAAMLVERSVEETSQRDEQGDLGSAETRKLPRLEQAIRDYFDLAEETKAKTYRVPKGLLKTKLIPYTYLRRRLKKHAEYYDDPRGEVASIKTALQDAVDMGLLSRVSAEQVLTETDGQYRPQGSEVYCLGPGWSNEYS